MFESHQGGGGRLVYYYKRIPTVDSDDRKRVLHTYNPSIIRSALPYHLLLLLVVLKPAGTVLSSVLAPMPIHMPSTFVELPSTLFLLLAETKFFSKVP
jgi:hypothetical protein